MGIAGLPEITLSVDSSPDADAAKMIDDLKQTIETIKGVISNIPV
jgi:hypothetical protein